VKHLIALAAAAILVVGCSSKDKNADNQGAAAQASPGSLAISAAFNPDPPRQGSEAITVAVKDAAGAPVKGAVVKITTQMPSMSMSGPGATAADNGDGTYSASLSLQYATSWHFIIAASADGRTVRSEVVQDVK
jgi:YtkA-like